MTKKRVSKNGVVYSDSITKDEKKAIRDLFFRTTLRAGEVCIDNRSSTIAKDLGMSRSVVDSYITLMLDNEEKVRNSRRELRENAKTINEQLAECDQQLDIEKRLHTMVPMSKRMIAVHKDLSALASALSGRSFSVELNLSKTSAFLLISPEKGDSKIVISFNSVPFSWRISDSNRTVHHVYMTFDPSGTNLFSADYIEAMFSNKPSPLPKSFDIVEELKLRRIN